MVTAVQAAPPAVDAVPAARVRGLSVTFPGATASLPTVHGVDLDLRPGAVTALVGESGAGKSVTVAAMLGLLPRSAEVSGRLTLPARDGRQPVEVDLADRAALARRVRGRRVALVPQSAATWLTPVRTVASQLAEAAAVVGDPSRGRVAADRARFPWELRARYPHELSGGQLQRAALALALVAGADLLLADEPTSGLDPQLADEAMAQLGEEAARGAAVLVVTHDLAAAEAVADEVVVLYAGRVVERAPAGRFFAGPAHPYAAGLLDSLPDRAFTPVPGDPPAPGERVDGCVFAPRCGRRTAACDIAPVLGPGVSVSGVLGSGVLGSGVPASGRAAVACHHPLLGAEATG